MYNLANVSNSIKEKQKNNKYQIFLIPLKKIIFFPFLYSINTYVIKTNNRSHGLCEYEFKTADTFYFPLESILGDIQENNAYDFKSRSDNFDTNDVEKRIKVESIALVLKNIFTTTLLKPIGVIAKFGQVFANIWVKKADNRLKEAPPFVY